MRSVALCCLTLLVACSTAPTTPHDQADAALTPKSVDTYVGNPSTKAYVRRTIEDVLGEPAQSLNRFITADTNIQEFKDARLVELLQQKWASVLTPVEN